MNPPTLAVVDFPGNNCATETARAAESCGFAAAVVRWNQVEKIGEYDAYILPGGFSFEDRGRSGAIAAREPIFDALREEAKTGKIILGICNGAQMIAESGLIPVGGNSLPCALADNVRRDQSGQVVGTGYYNVWNYITPERTDTAFTQNITGVVRVPIAHGEGRFTTRSDEGRQALKSGTHVAYRYCNEEGQVSSDYPVTPNGAEYAVAMMVNQEGTVGAIMPHPERFPLDCEGYRILRSMKAWIEADKSPSVVKIGDLSAQMSPKINRLEVPPTAIVLEKTLIITDNEGFSVNQAANHLVGRAFSLEKSWVYVIEGAGITREKLEQTGLIANPNKETLTDFVPKPHQFLVALFEDDAALHLADQLSEALGVTVTVRRFKAWNFPSDIDTEKILQNGLLCNPNSGQLYQTQS